MDISLINMHPTGPSQLAVIIPCLSPKRTNYKFPVLLLCVMLITSYNDQ